MAHTQTGRPFLKWPKQTNGLHKAHCCFRNSTAEKIEQMRLAKHPLIRLVLLLLLLQKFTAIKPKTQDSKRAVAQTNPIQCIQK